MSRGKGKGVEEKYNILSKLIEENPYYSIKELSKITGYPDSTICRILKDYGSSRKDIRKRENLIENLKRGGVI